MIVTPSQKLLIEKISFENNLKIDIMINRFLQDGADVSLICHIDDLRKLILRSEDSELVYSLKNLDCKNYSETIMIFK